MNELIEETTNNEGCCLTFHKEINKILIVGSWAKEQITIENLQKKNDVNVYAYMSTHNPAIVSLVDDYLIGTLDNTKQIVEYAKQQEIDLVLITTAQPLSVGVVDALEKEDILVFGPCKKAAQLESDKAFTRQLMKNHHINALPKFQVFKDTNKAIEYAETLNWEVAVKPIGLTEGLGVKIAGDQLKNRNDIISYIQEIFENQIGGDAKVLIEEKLQGTEFTIQCFVYGKQVVTTPAVKDFKRLLPGDKGPNTASMGSYSDKGFLLPFMTQKDYMNAVNIIIQTLTALNQETGEDCKGFLYGQFMKTTNGLKLIEYNFRPGDPEWMNTLTVLNDNLIDIIIDLMNQIQRPVHFEDKATVCKYIVPKRYPKSTNQVLEVTFDLEKIQKLGVNIYYSSGLDNHGKLRVGGERGIAFVAKDATIMHANKAVEKAISMVEGDFHHRHDIGTIEMMP
jgi:phosphoribosylamine--glycine ligase